MARVPIVSYDLREIYHELGDYKFKLILHPKDFKNGHSLKISCRDASGKAFPLKCETWGRKINFEFSIDKDTPDGVSVIDLELQDNSGKTLKHRISYWVIKP